MRLVGYFLLGFAPGLLWLWFFHRKDDYEPEPRLAVLRVFLLGMLATVPILFLRTPLESLLLSDMTGPRRALADAFFVTAIPEEVVKLAAFFLGAFLSRDLDEPLDGIIYGIAVGLGFASVENVFYLVRTEDVWLIVQRSFTATLGHVAFSGLAGWAFGYSRFLRRRGRIMLPAFGLLLAVVLHGSYDFFLTGGYPLLSLLFVLPAGLVLLALRIERERALSPEFHPDRS